ncbi:stAR-related lipid transfer protein 5-like isoform X2 [Ptychodera flava]|uniref:stAR-related lipid transfer protein 5-like isoform X2 n=1 Tax=Ptychodera flava TaxID=63121 RepID=UPI00396A151D
MDYRAEAEKAGEKLMGYYKDTDWKVSKVSKEVTVSHKKSAEFDGHIYKAECVLDGTPDEIVKYVIPTPLGVREKWDKTIKSSEVLESSEKDFFVVHSQTHSSAMGVISSRDFIDAVLINHLDEDNIVCTNSVSVEHPQCPPVDDVVRAFNHPGGTFCVPVKGEENKTKVINFLQSDLKGMLPRTLVETALPNTMIDFIIGLKTALDNKILHEPAED